MLDFVMRDKLGSLHRLYLSINRCFGEMWTRRFFFNVTHSSVLLNKPLLQCSKVMMHKDDVTRHAECVYWVSVIERDSVSVCVRLWACISVGISTEGVSGFILFHIANVIWMSCVWYRGVSRHCAMRVMNMLERTLALSCVEFCYYTHCGENCPIDLEWMCLKQMLLLHSALLKVWDDTS